MKVDQILKLIDAGFSRDEIMAMEAPADPAPTEPAPSPADPEPEADPVPAEPAPAEPAPAAAAPEGNDSYQKLLNAVEKLSNTMIKANINQTVAQPQTETVEDMLGKVIAPPRKKAKGE